MAFGIGTMKIQAMTKVIADWALNFSTGNTLFPCRCELPRKAIHTIGVSTFPVTCKVAIIRELKPEFITTMTPPRVRVHQVNTNTKMISVTGEEVSPLGFNKLYGLNSTLRCMSEGVCSSLTGLHPVRFPTIPTITISSTMGVSPHWTIKVSSPRSAFRLE